MADINETPQTKPRQRVRVRARVSERELQNKNIRKKSPVKQRERGGECRWRGVTRVDGWYRTGDFLSRENNTTKQKRQTETTHK